ncbi:MAG TPA: FmdB family zinc ribbon protein [Usitatibacter sp.]|nr:FmdB family zinc ribbon protein [Usitatibacter sp.]
MPIYEYRCSSCGHQQEFMQKLSDPALTVCTQCNQPTFSKMLTAAGFQLKGSGWYATDFKSKGAPAKPAESAEKKEGGEAKKPDGEAPKAAACGTGACAACQ